MIDKYKQKCGFVLAMFFIFAGPVLSVANVQLPQGEFTYAEWNGENSYQPVTDLIRGEKVYEMVLITLKSGERIQATDEHPLYVQGQGWRDAKLLKKGDRLYLQGKGSVKIASIKRETRQEKVYNLTVARNHTYYVGRDGVLVHNAGCGAKKGYLKDFSTKNTINRSAKYASERDARNLARTKIGKDPVQVEANKLRSQDGKWQYRGKPQDLTGHGPKDSPHIHLERLNPKTGEVLENWHLRW